MEMLELKKQERTEYPHLKTISELKKEKLMPRPRVKPRAYYKYYPPYSSKQKIAYLYDVDLTCPYKRTKEEQRKRRVKEHRRKAKHRRERELQERIDKLSEKITPCQTVIFDVETTGLNPEYDEIIQFSAINEHGEVLLNTYVKPEHHTSWENAEKINGISPDMVKDMPTIKGLWRKMQSIFLSANRLVAYNGQFDMQFLRKANIQIPQQVYYYDVMYEFSEIYGEWSDYYQCYRRQKLSVCASYYGYEFKAHDSLEDVKATLFCYKKMVGEDIEEDEEKQHL